MLRLATRRLLLEAFEGLYKQRSTYRYYRQLQASQWDEGELLAQRQLSALQQVVQYAGEHCPFYRETWQKRRLDPRSIQCLEDLHSWPLLTKADIRDNRPSLRSPQQCRNLIHKSTGGSTGAPLQFDITQDSHARRWAASLRGYEWCGAAPGSRQLYLWGVPLDTQSGSSRWRHSCYDWLHHRTVVNSFQLNQSTALPTAERLARYQPDSIVAYTSAVYYFAKDLAAQGIQPYSPKSIIVGAEKLYPFQRAQIEEVFQAPVYETYGSREFMLIGSECSERNGFHLTAEHLIVEILDDDGSPTPEGREGNVVVTDLHNYGMPFIRYVTGDRAPAGFSTCSCGRSLPVLGTVSGRSLDVIATRNGRRTPGEYFPHLFKDYAPIRKFQVVQKSDQHVLILVVHADNWDEGQQRQLLFKLHDQLGRDTHLEWKRVDRIPLTRAGKHQVVVHQDSVDHLQFSADPRSVP